MESLDYLRLWHLKLKYKRLIIGVFNAWVGTDCAISKPSPAPFFRQLAWGGAGVHDIKGLVEA